MNYLQYTEKLEAIKYFCSHKQTGTPYEFAKKLNVSERTIQRMVQQLRDNCYPIIYNRFRFTYEVEDRLEKF